MPKLFINFEGIISTGHVNCEEQNKILEPSIIIINNFVVIIFNAYYDGIIVYLFHTIIIILHFK